jgi:LPS export ABC transporter protein LptC
MRDTIDKILPTIIWIAVIILATWAAWVIVISREKIPSEVEVQPSSVTGEIPPAVVDQPILEEVSADGSVRWTLYLDKIIREEGSLTELSKPRALYWFQSGEVLEVTGDSGTYDEDTGLLILSGNVKGAARNADLKFTVDRMKWDSHQSILTASGNVQVVREGISFKGQELKLDLTHELTKLEVTGGVDITTSPEVLQKIDSTKLGR